MLCRLGFFTLLMQLAAFSPAQADQTLLNVSYDPTRELYKSVNQSFAENWKKETG